MRYFLFLLILFSFSCRVPQTLEGNYFEDINGFCGRNWHFNKDGTFSLEAHCEGDRSNGKGIYQVSHDTIHFLFGDVFDSRDSAHSFVEVIKENNLQNDSSEIKFEVIDDSTHEVVLFPLIVIADSLGKNLAGIQGGIDGKAKLSINGYKGKVVILIQCNGYRSAHYTLVNPGNCTVKANLVWTNGRYPIEEGNEWEFRVRKAGRKIILKSKVTETYVGMFREKERTIRYREKLVRK